jgi:putative ABC transport system permease protein
MKWFPLIWMNVWRRRIRTTFTLLSIFIAFLLFGIVMTVRSAFGFGIDIAGNDRLVLINKVTLILPLPISYAQRIQQTKGVEKVTHQTWFGGTYKEARNAIASMAVDLDTFLEIYREIELPPEQIAAWKADRQGVIVGKNLAKTHGWKLGDRFQLLAPSWQPREPWEFNISGIYDGGPSVDKTQIFLRYDYLDENRGAGAEGIVGWYVVKIADPTQAVELGRTFDEMFANSGAETKTTTEKGFVEGFAKQVGDIGAITVAIASIVLFMFGMVAASTMVQSVRERTSELAVLKTLGFADGKILLLVLSESLIITIGGGGLGLLTAWAFVRFGGDPTGGLLPLFVLPPSTLAVGVVLMVLMGVVAGIMPAMGAMRLKITDALRKT